MWDTDLDHEGRRNLYFADGSGRATLFRQRSQADDAYASYDFKRHELLFCSNRSGSFRLYRYKPEQGHELFPVALANVDLAAEIEPVAELDGAGETMAPCLRGQLAFLPRIVRAAGAVLICTSRGARSPAGGAAKPAGPAA